MAIMTATEAAETLARTESAHAVLDEIAGLERSIAALQARQLQATARYVEERTRLDDALGFAGQRGAYRSMVIEIAMARGVSQASAQSFMSDAWRLARSLPATIAALESGDLSLTAARIIARETAVLDDPALGLADAVIAEEAVGLVPGKVAALASRIAIEVDPDAALRRAESARGRDCVSAVMIGDDTGVLSAHLRADQAAACWHALHDHANARKADGDERSVDRLMCDTLVERVTGSAIDKPRGDVCVIMTDASLLGIDQTPAQLVGPAGGPITASLARLIASSESVALRRLYTDPVDDAVTRVDARRRFADGALRRLIMVADQACRGINCTRGIDDVDHVRPYRESGPTAPENLQGLSAGCHASRDHPQMRAGPSPLHPRAVVWATPSGLSRTTIPPPALGPGSLSLDRSRFRRLLADPPESPTERRLLQIIVESMRAKSALN